MVLFILIILLVLFYLFLAYKIKLNQDNNYDIYNPQEFKELSLLIPCYNEGIVLKSAIHSLTRQNYPNLEIVFINDGSDDNTLNILKENLNLVRINNKIGKLKSNEIIATYSSKKYKNIFVIDKKNGGKADSLNAGINFTKKDYVITLDADSILRDDALFHINNSLQNEDVIAVGGNVIAAQGVSNYNGDIINCKTNSTFIELMQFIEYSKSFFISRNCYAHLNALSVISGAFGVFKRNIMLELNGFHDTIGEDIDITIKFNKYAIENNKTILYNDAAMCFTEVPNNWHDLKNQRVRWQKALLDAIKNHFKFLFKNLFRSKLSFFMIFESIILMYSSTIITLSAYVLLIISLIKYHRVNTLTIILFIVGTTVSAAYNLCTFNIMKRSHLYFKNAKKSKLVLVFFYELLVYRNVLIAILLYASVEFFFNPKGWNKVKRIGSSDSILLFSNADEIVA